MVKPDTSGYFVMTESKDYHKWVKMAAQASIGVATVLVIIKSYAWFVSGASAMLASTTDSLLDLFASVVNFIILRFALMPADNEHRFGHGKAESLAGLGQSTFIAGSAILLMYYGIEQAVNPTPIASSPVAVVITLLSIVLTLMLVCFQKWVIRRTQSVLVGADALHYQSDLLLNAGVLVALILSEHVWLASDGVFTFCVGIYLLCGAFSIGGSSVNHLMDRELPDEELEQIQQVIEANADVMGFHSLKTRQAGPQRFIQLHLELSGDMTLHQTHKIADDIEQTLSLKFAPCEVIIHQDPSS